MALDVGNMQLEHREWRDKNFPEAEPWEALLGLQEEVGELAHAHLKGKWGIRGMSGEALAAAKMDAVGDIFIYLMSYADTNSLDLEHCIRVTWDRVLKRDWVADPEGTNA